MTGSTEAQALEAAKIILQVVCAVAIVTNLLVVVVLATTKTLRVKYYGLIFNLAITDIITSIVAILFQHVPHPVVLSLTGICFLNEGLNILAVAVNRLLALSINPPARYDAIATSGRMAVVCLLMWGLAFALTFPFEYLTENDIGRLVTPIIVVIIVLLTTVVYVMVFRKIAQYGLSLRAPLPDEAETRMRRDRHLMVTFTVILAAFAICWIPNIVANLITHFSGEEFWSGQAVSFRVFFKSSVVILASNAAINPVIYWGRMEEFRRGLKRLFFCACGKQATAVDNTETYVESTL
ncbi:lysophosphatidic acid receptor 2-like [Patiria miniata]|uniref:G-protein coupled receptors family 1 profile domain-containing protein n=1 Tax=Patiria miniata TaxID=46514 RepID=A0A913ZN50_PATMI|nr:lysophosphatidic acid receptor 2-like [Patiria miniata]